MKKKSALKNGESTIPVRSTLERLIGGGKIVDLIFKRHLSDISRSLLSILRSLQYIGGAHKCDDSLIISLKEAANLVNTGSIEELAHITRQ